MLSSCNKSDDKARHLLLKQKYKFMNDNNKKNQQILNAFAISTLYANKNEVLCGLKITDLLMFSAV